jgi:hypothetical protein
MPYKNLVAKQQWEREHREQRNARRRRRHVTARIENIGPISVPDPRVREDKASAINSSSSAEQRSPLLGVGYVVAILAVFVGLGLVTYFARADKAPINIQPDPMPATEPKKAWTVVGIAMCVVAVGLLLFVTLAGSFGAEGGNTYDPCQRV